MPAKPWMSDAWFRDEGTGVELHPSGNATVRWCTKPTLRERLELMRDCIESALENLE